MSLKFSFVKIDNYYEEYLAPDLKNSFIDFKNIYEATVYDELIPRAQKKVHKMPILIEFIAASLDFDLVFATDKDKIYAWNAK